MATLFKDSFKCSLLPVEEYSCFELQLVKLELMLFIVHLFTALLNMIRFLFRTFQTFFLLMFRPLIILISMYAAHLTHW